MLTPPLLPLPQAVTGAWRALAERTRRWRTAAAAALPLQDVAADLPRDTTRALEAAVRGEADGDPAWVTAAARTWFWIHHAGEVADAAAQWAEARAELDEAPVSPADALRLALGPTDPLHAASAWTAAGDALLPVVHRFWSPLCAAARAATLPGDEKERAERFLARSRDAWADVRDHVARRHVPARGFSGTLRVARMRHSAWMQDVLPTAVCRHVARRAVEHWGFAPGSIRRVAVGAWPLVPGFAFVGEDGHPRVGWAEARGTAPLLELLRLTLEAATAGRLVTPTAPDVGRVVALATALGVLDARSLRHATQLAPADADAVVRHAVYLLLREARLRAVLCSGTPSTPGEALDVLESATGDEPDLLEAAALMVPWPDAGSLPGALSMDFARGWRAFRVAGAVATSAREQWDSDFPYRPVYQRRVVDTLAEATGAEAVAAWARAMGAAPEEEALAGWFESALQ